MLAKMKSFGHESFGSRKSPAVTTSRVEVETACRSFESYLVEMVVEEGNVRDLMDVEELLYCWNSLKSPVFIELVCAFYGELCRDLFPDFRRMRRMDGYEKEDFKRNNMRQQPTMMPQQHHLIRPGSSPPQCTFKCGKCTPCQPIHVPFPPGTYVIDEYYPETWRCMCGNHLFMP
ncbi:uncharacterized protein LOC110028420 [Phalaenopsis equestris]|uniref:uncharacterized protein LOC110028420 n=1 Tax=Phalaenopsis equestris TaxID=78828 RepID=UPI0009E3578C|nr:uncharacterized protein LOC110028420 [Phalaenopsis equestris]